MGKYMVGGDGDKLNQDIMDLRSKGMTLTKIAKKLGISQSNVSKRIAAVKQAATNGAILSKATDSRIQRDYVDPISGLYDLHKNTQRVYEEAIRRYESMLGNNVFDHDALLEITKEIRGQLELQVKITEKMFHAERMRIFRDCILETLDETHPDLKQEFLERLNQKKVMYGTTVI